MSLIITDLRKRFDRFPALDGVSLTARRGEFVALLGPSGSGKTTLLRVLAGLERPDSGAVQLRGEDFLAVEARRRRIGMVFQSYALFRHMSVAQNIAFGLDVRPKAERPSKAEIAARVAELLELVQLQGLEKRRPAQLSGGQRQRVALARALAVQPQLLLLDEPFGALDAKVRLELRRQLRAIHEATHLTTLFVTHDQEEAMTLADQVAVLHQGRIEQAGAPQDLARNPASAFVFEFLGETNELPAEVLGEVARFDGFSAPVAGGDGAIGQVRALFRPQDVELSTAPDAVGVAVRVTDFGRHGPVTRFELADAAGRAFSAAFAEDQAPALALGAAARLKPRRVHVYARG
jgi:sulfate/thiosulfate transport system ATP-binding protein